MQSTDDPNSLRAWLRDVMTATGLKATPLAKQAGIAPSTIIRALDPSSPGDISIRTIRKIVQHFGVQPPDGYGLTGNDKPPRTLAAPEATRLDGNGTAIFPQITSAQTVWQLLSNSLNMAGYLPGDYVLVDGSVEPETGDIVCVSVENGTPGASAIFRVYDRPYLVTNTSDPEARRKPMLVDGERVSIIGTVIHQVRLRQAS